jgi:hypothetical protein
MGARRWFGASRGLLLLPVVWLLAGLLLVRPAGAAEVPEPGSVALSWLRLQGAERCPSLAEIARRVDSLLGRASFVGPAEARWFVEASIEPRHLTAQAGAEGWLVRIHLVSSGGDSLGKRELVIEGTSCHAAANSAALAIAILMAPDAELNEATAAFEVPAGAESRDQEPAPSPSAPGATPTSRATPADSEERRAPPSAAEPFRASLSVSALAAAGSLPELALGAVAGVRGSPFPHRVGLELSGIFLAQTSAEQRSGAGGTFWLAGGELAAFWSPLASKTTHLSVSSGLQSGAVVASGYGYTASNTKGRASFFLTASVDTELSWQLARGVRFLVRPGLGVPLWHDSFVASVEGESPTIFEPLPLVAELALGLRFWP